MTDAETLDGTVGISMEIELGWAKHDKHSIDHLSERRVAETETLKRLLSRCDELNIPITFNIVGHLLLEECDGAHAERPSASSWFEMDPGTNHTADPAFYAPDLVEMITASSVNHEICTHTFSHTPCNDATTAEVEWELAESKRTHESAGLSWSSAMVPPRHSLPEFETVQKYGIDTLRVPHPKRTFQMSKPERLYYSLLAPHPKKRPEILSDMCLTYSSPYLSLAAPDLPHGQLDPHPVFQLIPRRWRKRWHKHRMSKALDTVATQAGTAHFWSHLWDISNSIQWPLVESFLTELFEKREKENIELVLLKDVRERVKAGQV